MSEQSEMKLFGASDADALKQHFGRKIMELEDEKRDVQVQLNICKANLLLQKIFIYLPYLFMQRERDHLLSEFENLAANSDGQTQKSEDMHAQRLKALEAQVKSLIPILYQQLDKISTSDNIFITYEC